jgi:BRCT domain type II-containing protein
LPAPSPHCVAAISLLSHFLCRGGEFHKTLKKSTSWLLVGERPGANKLAAAAKWGTKVLSEEEFFLEIERLTLQKQGYM